jgi:hypothetical protein
MELTRPDSKLLEKGSFSASSNTFHACFLFKSLAAVHEGFSPGNVDCPSVPYEVSRTGVDFMFGIPVPDTVVNDLTIATGSGSAVVLAKSKTKSKSKAKSKGTSKNKEKHNAGASKDKESRSGKDEKANQGSEAKSPVCALNGFVLVYVRVFVCLPLLAERPLVGRPR